MRKREAKLLTRGLTTVAGSILATVAGLLALHLFFAAALARLSYDLPFLWRAPRSTEPVTLVYLDEDSARKLNQPLGAAWNRTLHAQLIDRLTAENARLAMFDVVFDAPSQDPATDDALAEALQRNGRIILGAAVENVQPLGSVAQERVLPPTRLLRKAAAGWGLLAFRPVDPDNGVRRIYLGSEDIPAATWKAAEILRGEAALPPRENSSHRWINYYGPPNEFSSVSFAQAIQPEGLPA
ncbi:MAG: CHASE2 domain-containing protein, partial [Chthoniobacterales bacterium]